MIFDGHAYCWPPLTGNAGFDTHDELRRHLQRAMAGHHQAAWRVGDRAPGDSAPLAPDGRRTKLEDLPDLGFDATSHGRLEWTLNGDRYIKQYFPPSQVDMAYPPENLVAEMDYAGVDRALLHRTAYLGVGNEFTAQCVRKFPGRLLGLADTRDWLVEENPEAAVAELEHAVKEQGLSGLQLRPLLMNNYGERGEWDGERYRSFWDGAVRLGVPIFFSFAEDLLNEYPRLLRWMERYPQATVVITHGFPWRRLMDDEKVDLTEEVWAPFENRNAYLQLLFPIALGNVWDYPLSQVQPALEQCVRRIGAGRLMWGTDMPIVLRFWTYRQNIDFIRNYCDFLSAEERDLILGGTAERLLVGT